VYFPTLDMIASRNVLTIGFDASIAEAIETMHRHNHRNVIVTHGSLYYVLTTVDLIAAEPCDADFSRPLSALELRPVPTMRGSDNVINAIAFINKEHEYICVLDDREQLAGIVTNSDIIGSVDPQIMLENTPLSALFEASYRYPEISETAPMPVAIETLRSSRKDCLVVTAPHALSGILTAKDILRYFKSPDLSAPVSAFMSAPLQTLPADTSITEALAFVRKKHFKRIVVVDPEGGLVGIVSQKDLIAQSYLRWSSLLKEHYHEIKELSRLLEEQNRQLVKLATRDRLTGVHNRHMFEEQYEKECAFARRYGVGMHLLIIDIDHFKSINDRFGHIAGDGVLKTFAARIERHARSSDFFARWGGEEFVLLMHHADDADALGIADKLRACIADVPFDAVGPITCSIGLCRVDPDTDLAANLSRADRALYAAKEAGRNRISLCANAAL